MRRSTAYERVLEEIYSLDRFGSKLGLERIRKILAAAGNPQEKYRCVIVGGSNGKGSTVEMIGKILEADGKRVGTYFSPQVEEFSERIRINGKNASKGDICWAYAKVKGICQSLQVEATFFEVVTAMAAAIFEKRGVEVAVLEVGLGGRLDATNAFEPSISAVSSISFEHTDILGKTIPEIAHEKCGIARKGKKLVLGSLSGEAEDAVRKECEIIGATPIFTDAEVFVPKTEERDGKYSFKARYCGHEFHVSLSAAGRFQVSNAKVALALCHELGASRKAIERGLFAAKPRYRMETIGKNPLVIADCCHNPEAAYALGLEVWRLHTKKRVLLFSAMADKDYEQVLSILRPHFDEVVLTQLPLRRGAGMKELMKAAHKTGIKAACLKSPKAALSLAKKKAGKDGCVIIAGSIYLLAFLFGRDKKVIAQ
ncbi:MAG: bifunctional folylpolyglutamate synthase/dihydrofolate synthase [Candidatus Micrarchaeota archaeon]|nr:bifunctional folylpolyglutamate synthase/dihydrofolate synthase [Candidatus Micrarchaeota archaeon]